MLSSSFPATFMTYGADAIEVMKPYRPSKKGIGALKAKAN